MAPISLQEKRFSIMLWKIYSYLQYICFCIYKFSWSDIGEKFPSAQCNYIKLHYWMKCPYFLLVGSHLFVSSLFTKKLVSAFTSSWSTYIDNYVTKSLPSSSLQDLDLKNNDHRFKFGLEHECLQRLGPFFHKSSICGKYVCLQ